MNTFANIFHPNLEKLCFDNDGLIHITTELDSMVKKSTKNNLDYCIDCHKLKYVALEATHDPHINAVRIFDSTLVSKFNILNNVEEYRIEWNARYQTAQSEGYCNSCICNFLRKNLGTGTNSSCSKVKYIKFVIEDIDTDQGILFGESAGVLIQLSQFSQKNLISATQNDAFEYFCIEWKFDVEDPKEFINDDDDNEPCYDLCMYFPNNWRRETYDINSDIITDKTDFSIESLAIVHLKIMKWLEAKAERSNAAELRETLLQIQLRPM